MPGIAFTVESLVGSDSSAYPTVAATISLFWSFQLPVGFKEILNIYLVLLVRIQLLQGDASGVIPNLLQPKIKRQPDFFLAVPTFKDETYSSHSCHRKTAPFSVVIPAEFLA